MGEIDVLVARPADLDVDTLGVGVAEPGSPLPPALADLDGSLQGRLSALAQAGDIRGRRDTATIVHVDGTADVGARRIGVGGLGRPDRVDADAVRTAAAAVARKANEIGGTMGWLLDSSLPLSAEEQVRAAVEGTLLGAYRPGRWKTIDDLIDRRRLNTLVLVTDDADALALPVDRAGRIAGWTNRARDLSNMPPNELTPERLARTAEEIGAEVSDLTVEILGLEQTRELGMGAFNAVAQGSRNPAQMIVMRYEPSDAPAEPVLGLVGKAITFDTGGISIKPSERMEEMKHDMSGGAAVVAAMGAIADLRIPLRTVAVVAATENMPDGGAYRPGDILTARNGKTIEVISTDAEGRLVLADALTYAREQGATHVLDLATLTGAMVVALGDLYAGVFANDEPWRDAIVEAGGASGDRVWPMPLDPRYRRLIDSTYADMRNTGKARMAGAQAGAELLQEFAGEGPWAHLDIAGPAALSHGRGDYLSQHGGTGYGVRLIAELASQLAG
jgi:leucyl aminopeptidase